MTGLAGTTFDREDFQRLISDIEAKKINLVIVKDLSRLGRDYIQTGYYIEKYFPSKRVRFIAVNDGYDSLIDSTGNEMVPFKSVFNDMYAKDISKKVRTALRTKQNTGFFLGTTAPFRIFERPGEKRPSDCRSGLLPICKANLSMVSVRHIRTSHYKQIG